MLVRPPHIGIWGPSKAGKTTYLASLFTTLHQAPGAWRIWPANDEASQFAEKCITLASKGIFPPSSPEPIEYIFHVYHEDDWWLPIGRNGRFHALTIVDAPGRMIFDPSKEGERLFSTLGSSWAILVMIDPDEKSDPELSREEGGYAALLQRLITQLSRAQGNLDKRGKLDISIAFCITKMDQGERWSKRETPRQYLESLMGSRAFSTLLSLCDSSRIRFYGVSAVGRYTPNGADAEEPNIVCYDEADQLFRIASVNQWKPYNVFEPLLWLFDQIEARKDRVLPWWRQKLRTAVRMPSDVGTRDEYKT